MLSSCVPGAVSLLLLEPLVHFLLRHPFRSSKEHVHRLFRDLKYASSAEKVSSWSLLTMVPGTSIFCHCFPHNFLRMIFFASHTRKLKSLLPGLHLTLISGSHSLGSLFSQYSYFPPQISTTKIRQLLGILNVSKLPCREDIPNIVIKIYLPELVPLLCRFLFFHAPFCLFSLLDSIPKASDISDPNGGCSISFPSVLLKVFETTIS